MSYPHHQQFLFSSNNTQPTAPAPAAVSEQDSAEPLTQQDAAGFTNPFFISDYGYDQQLLLQQLAYGLEVADYISLDDVDVAGANSFGVEGTQTPISSDQPHLLQLQTTTATTTPTVSYTEEETGSTGVSPRASHQAPAPAKKAKSDGATNKKIGFRTKSEIEIMDDGFKWRKYGKKSVKNSPNPRNYYKCSAEGCRVKKRVERDREDARYVITTYEGVHNHISPSEAALFYNTFPVGGSGRGGLISLTAGGAVPSPSPPYRWPTTSNTAAVAAYSAGAESSNGPDGWDACIPFSFS